MVGVDVGGTFTDFYVLDETGGAVLTGKRPSTPDNPARAIIDGLQALASRHGIDLGALRRLAPRHDGGHQRAHPAPRGQHRDGHHARVPRPARDRPPDAPAHVLAHRGPSAAARRATPAVRDRRADGRRRRGCHVALRRGRRHGGRTDRRERRRRLRHLPRVRVPQSRARGSHCRRAPVRPPRCPRLHVVRGPARVSRVRTVLHHGAERLPPAGARTLSLDARGRARTRDARRLHRHQPVERRPDVARTRAGASGAHRAVGPRGRRDRRRAFGEAERTAQCHHPGHGRHERRRRADPRLSGRHLVRARRGRLLGPASGSGHRDGGGRRRDRSPGSIGTDCSRSARRARAPIRAPRAMRAAASGRLSRTRTSCSGGCRAADSWPARWSSTSPFRGPRSRRSPNGSDSRSNAPRTACSASSWRTWCGPSAPSPWSAVTTRASTP